MRIAQGHLRAAFSTRGGSPPSPRVGASRACRRRARYGLWAGNDGRMHLQFAPHARAGPASAHVCHWLPTEAACRSLAGQPSPTACGRWRAVRTRRRRSRCSIRRSPLDSPTRAGAARDPREAAGERASARLPSLGRARTPASSRSCGSGCERSGHIVEQQVHVVGVGRVDMRVDGVLYLEIDGFAFHHDREQFERDRARDAILAARGLQRLRVSAAQVLGEWEVVAEQRPPRHFALGELTATVGPSGRGRVFHLLTAQQPARRTRRKRDTGLPQDPGGSRPFDAAAVRGHAGGGHRAGVPQRVLEQPRGGLVRRHRVG